MKKSDVVECLRRYIAEQRKKSDDADFDEEYLRSSWAFGAIDFAFKTKQISCSEYKDLSNELDAVFHKTGEVTAK